MGRGLHKPLACAGCSCPATDHQVSPTRPMQESQSSADQPQADAAREIATAERLWWSSVVTGRRTKLTLRSRVGTAQHHTLSKGRHSTTMMFNRYARQAVLCPNTPKLTVCNNMAWNQRISDKHREPEEQHAQAEIHFHRFAKAKLTQRTEYVRGDSSSASVSHPWS